MLGDVLGGGGIPFLSAKAYVYLVIDVRSADELRYFTSDMIKAAGASFSF